MMGISRCLFYLKFTTYMQSHLLHSQTKHLNQRGSYSTLKVIDKLFKNKNPCNCHLKPIQKNMFSSKVESTTDTQAWESLVDYSRLSPLETKIHKRHVSAIKTGQSFYTDPVTGYMVMTRLAHVQRGDCCGNACRHCPFGHKNVPEHRKTKKFNSAFYY